MDLQDAIILVLEEWRQKRGLTSIDVGRAICSEDTSPRIAGEVWGRIRTPRKDTKKNRQLTVVELDALASFFGVNPETIVIEARQKLGKNSGRRPKDEALAG